MTVLWIEIFSNLQYIQSEPTRGGHCSSSFTVSLPEEGTVAAHPSSLKRRFLKNSLFAIRSHSMLYRLNNTAGFKTQGHAHAHTRTHMGYAERVEECHFWRQQAWTWSPPGLLRAHRSFATSVQSKHQSESRPRCVST